MNFYQLWQIMEVSPTEIWQAPSTDAQHSTVRTGQTGQQKGGNPVMAKLMNLEVRLKSLEAKIHGSHHDLDDPAHIFHGQ